MKYPKGTRFQAWSLYKEKQRGVTKPVIRRWVILPGGKAKCERMPVERYEHFREKPEELNAFLIRENAEVARQKAAEDRTELNHAWINDELVAKYKARRLREVPSKDRVSTEIYYIQKHFLSFFIGKQGLASPKEWYRTHKDEWADYLMSAEVPKAPATKREIIQSANRFITWLHEERPTEVPEMHFQPLSKERFKDMNARHEIDPTIKKRTFIKSDHWEEIKKNLPPEITSFVMIAYCYGVRRGETLGFLPGDVKKGHLSVERQLEKLDPKPSYMPTKGKMTRTVPHWYSTPSQTYLWIEAVQKLRIDPDHLTELWNDLMEALGFTYDFHDLRHTFITRAIREKNHRDVQLAAGHKHLKTTMGYAHDDRNKDDEVFVPVA